MSQWKLVPDSLFDDAKQIFCSDVEPNTNGDCADVIEWFKASIAAAPQPDDEPVAKYVVTWVEGICVVEPVDDTTDYPEEFTKLFTYPPDAAKKIAECVEQLHLKDETIDRLQDELITLQGELHDLKEQRSLWLDKDIQAKALVEQEEEITALRQRNTELEKQRDELVKALQDSTSALFLQIEPKHGPKISSEYPEIVKAKEVIAKVNTGGI